MRYSLFLCLLLCGTVLSAQAVTPWLTKGDQSVLLQQRPTVNFGTTSDTYDGVITIDATNTFQTLDAYGFMLTQGSAQVIAGLAPGQQKKLLRELFTDRGLNLSAIRISIGASDLSNSTYTYNETDGDTDMSEFSLEGPDATYLLPIIRQILEIRPDIKILATPWTAPTWMKTNGSYVGGRLLTEYYEAYARYFVTYLTEMRARGIEIWAITPQNEPENPFNNPSMQMNASEQLAFVDGFLGPQIEAAGFAPLIIGFDHNCDNPAYPITVARGSDYVDGSAFHLYAGQIETMTTVRSATGKGVYFTEQYTDVNGSFDGDFGWHLENVVIGSLNNWSKSVFEWNLAADPELRPYTDGGCTECLPAVTVSGRSQTERNVSYYIMGQLAPFVQPGAVRIGSSSSARDVIVTALQNPDNSRTVLAYNRGGEDRTVAVRDGGEAFTYTVPARSAVTFVWNSDGTAINDQSPYDGNPIPLPGTLEIENFDLGGQGYAYNDLSVGNSGGQYRDTDVDIEACSEGGFNIGFTDDREWLEYTVTVAADGRYDLDFRVSTPNDNAALSVTKKGLDLTGRVILPNTGGYQDWQTATVTGVELAEGTQILRINILTGGFNFNRVDVTESDPVVEQTPFGGTPIQLPGTIEIEDFDEGGQNVAYSDRTPGNSGGQYRETDVDIENCSEGGYNIGYTDDGEWLEYTVLVEETGSYDFGLRVSTPNTTSALSISIDGVPLTGSVAVPNTGGYQDWQTTTVQGVSLVAGTHVLRVDILTGGFNVNRVNVSKSPPIDDGGTTAAAFPSVSSLSVPQVFPNPVTNLLNVKLPEDHGYTDLEVFGSDGQLLRRRKLNPGTPQTSLDISDLSSGAYLLRLTAPAGVSWVSRIIKQ
ncbi:MAG: carbohydrate-binding protein [Lewinella sp.]